MLMRTYAHALPESVRTVTDKIGQRGADFRPVAGDSAVRLDVPIDQPVEVAPQLVDVDPRRAAERCCDLTAGREPTPADRHQLSDGHAVAGDHEGLPLRAVA
jgi:hypothetical protein